MSSSIESKSKGGELISFKINGDEKIHDGKEFWNRNFPVLFPIVGKLKDNKTVIEGNEYCMNQHGFARDMEYEIVQKTDVKHTYVLNSNEETLKKYPYKFSLINSFEIDKNTLCAKYKIINKDSKRMCFGIGGHPAFKVDSNAMANGEYSLQFNDVEDDIKFACLEYGLISDKEAPNLIVEGNKIKLDNNTFDNDALILKNIKSNKVSLIRNEQKVFTFDFSGFPYLGIWSKKGANFICIEPWYSIADSVNSDGIYENKEGIKFLEPNEEFECEFKVEFF